MDDLQQLTAVDLGIAVIVGASALLALARGGVREIFSIAGWLGALVVAFATFGQARPAMRDLISEPLLADAAALVLVFLVPFIALKIMAGLISRRVNAGALLGPVDKLLGFAFGAVRGALIVAVAYLVLSFFVAPERQPAMVQQARLLPQVRQAAGVLVGVLPENLANLAIATGAVPPPEPEPAPAGSVMPASGAAPASPAPPLPERGYTDQQRQGVERLLPPPRP